MRRHLLPLAVLTGALLAPGSAGAAITVGELAPAGEPASACYACSFFGSAVTDAATAPGVVTRWAVRPGASTPAGNTARLRIFRPIDGGRVRLVAESAPAELTQGFVGADARVPVEAGDLLGLELNTPGGTTASAFAQPGAKSSSIQGAPSIGTELATFTTWSGYRQNLSATIEPDADRDGFGDETQDGCATDAATQGACPVAAPPPPPPPAADTVKPTLAFAPAAAPQRVGSGRVQLRVTPSEAGTLTAVATASVRRSGRAIRLTARPLAVQPGRPAVVKLPLGSSARALKAAVRSGRAVRLKVTLTVADAAGNRSSYKRTVKLAR